ncbi:hypothetical protein LTS18_000866, partial [Coniosporium uncinatum]
VDERVTRIIAKTTRKAIKKEEMQRRRAERKMIQNGIKPKLASKPTLPNLVDAYNEKPEDFKLSRQDTASTLATFATERYEAEKYGPPSRTNTAGTLATLPRQPTLPDLSRHGDRPAPPSRTATGASNFSTTSFASDAPLLDQSGGMGYGDAAVRAQSPATPGPIFLHDGPSCRSFSGRGQVHGGQRSYTPTSVSRPATATGSGRRSPGDDEREEARMLADRFARPLLHAGTGSVDSHKRAVARAGSGGGSAGLSPISPISPLDAAAAARSRSPEYGREYAMSPVDVGISPVYQRPGNYFIGQPQPQAQPTSTSTSTQRQQVPYTQAPRPQSPPHDDDGSAPVRAATAPPFPLANGNAVAGAGAHGYVAYNPALHASTSPFTSLSTPFYYSGHAAATTAMGRRDFSAPTQLQSAGAVQHGYGDGVGHEQQLVRPPVRSATAPIGTQPMGMGGMVERSRTAAPPGAAGGYRGMGW